MPRLIDKKNFEMLVQAGAVRAVHIIGIPGGYAIEAEIGMTRSQIHTQQNRQQVRLFSKIDTAARFVRGAGIRKFDVDLSNYNERGLF